MNSSLSFFNFFSTFSLVEVVVFVVFLIWIFYWKALALWKSARNNQIWWFIFLFLINTFSILDIFYIFVFSKKKKTDSQVKNESLK